MEVGSKYGKGFIFLSNNFDKQSLGGTRGLTIQMQRTDESC
jgi:hypothetical protein